MKSTQGEIRRRVELIAKVILFGGEFSDIRQYVSETDEATRRPWKISDRNLFRYQNRAYELIEKQTEKSRPRVWARHVQQRRQMFALAMESGDIGAALQVAKDEAALHGIYPGGGKTPGGDTNSTVNIYVDASGTRITESDFERLSLEERIRILRDPVSPPPENRIGKLEGI